MMLQISFTSWMHHFLDYMGGCFGCFSKYAPTTAVDGSPKGLGIQAQSVKKPCLSDDFWSTSTCDMDISAIQSRRSLSSVTVSNQSLSSGSGSTGIQSEFVNPGLIRWNQLRLEWANSRKSENRTKPQEPVLSWNATYDNLLSTNRRFPHAIPLSEMVEFLVDIWENEGLYD